MASAFYVEGKEGGRGRGGLNFGGRGGALALLAWWTRAECAVILETIRKEGSLHRRLPHSTLIRGHAPCLPGRRPSSAVHHFGLTLLVLSYTTSILGRYWFRESSRSPAELETPCSWCIRMMAMFVVLTMAAQLVLLES